MSENKCEGCSKCKDCRTKIINVLVNNDLKCTSNFEDKKDLFELILRNGFKGYENMTAEELQKEVCKKVLQDRGD